MSRHSFASFSCVRVRTAVLTLTAALLLSSCQGGSAPGGPPSETSSTTASPTSSASVPTASAIPSAPPVYKPADAKGKAENVPVPVMPELAKENSKAGLEAFIGYWYELGNYADETGDVSGLSTLSTPECKACTHFQNAAVDSSKNGRWIVGGKVSIPRIEMAWNAGETAHQAKVQVIQEAITYYNADGTEGRPADAATNDAFVIVASFESTWKVVDTGVIR
ncbi:DUF6318 family protein [Paenarthrobacter nitroguajacolicus]|uniref:DUF6318 family protein n=1 Tax=Paenarthrobacter nitroguajacolicus TaxID=211146 RepID=UPI000AE631D1|nr:DUF6318 family protein [Paenarthrobacter nitroguajacolicus]